MLPDNGGGGGHGWWGTRGVFDLLRDPFFDPISTWQQRQKGHIFSKDLMSGEQGDTRGGLGLGLGTRGGGYGGDNPLLSMSQPWLPLCPPCVPPASGKPSCLLHIQVDTLLCDFIKYPVLFLISPLQGKMHYNTPSVFKHVTCFQLWLPPFSKEKLGFFSPPGDYRLCIDNLVVSQCQCLTTKALNEVAPRPTLL